MSDILDDFPGLSTVYLRIPWAFLEPEEGKYNWAILDTPDQRWIAKGKRIALTLTDDDGHRRNRLGTVMLEEPAKSSD